VWLYFRFPLSLRLVEELLLERGIVVSYETIRPLGGEVQLVIRGARADRTVLWRISSYAWISAVTKFWIADINR